MPSADRGRTRKTYAHLTILSDHLSPEEMEAGAGLAADISWAKGDAHRGSKRRHKFNGIVFESELDRENAEPDEHIEALLRRLGSNASQISKLADDDRVESARFWLYWDTTGGNPGLSFSPETLQSVAALGATLDLDIYVFDDEDD